MIPVERGGIYNQGMANPIVRFESSLGTFDVEVFEDAMPLTAGNFLRLVREGFYDGLHVHRVIERFMVQFACPHSRDPKSRLAGTGDSPHGTIRDEFLPTAKLTNAPGTLSMANTGDPHSGSCQLFINTVHNDYLDWFTPGASRHPVFAKVVRGFDIVQAIEKVATDGDDRPRKPVRMTRVSELPA